MNSPTNHIYRYFIPFLRSTDILDRTSWPKPRIRDRLNLATTMSTTATRKGAMVRQFMDPTGMRKLRVGSPPEPDKKDIIAWAPTELMESGGGLWRSASFGSGRRVGAELIRLSRSAPVIRE